MQKPNKKNPNKHTHTPKLEFFSPLTQQGRSFQQNNQVREWPLLSLTSFKQLWLQAPAGCLYCWESRSAMVQFIQPNPNTIKLPRILVINSSVKEQNDAHHLRLVLQYLRRRSKVILCARGYYCFIVEIHSKTRAVLKLRETISTGYTQYLLETGAFLK